MRIDIGITVGAGSTDPLAAFRTTSASLKLLWLPASFVATGGTVASVVDLSGTTPTIALTGSPAQATTGGLNAIQFDATNDSIRVTGISCSDSCTLLMLWEPLVASSGTQAFVWEASDNGTVDRSVQVRQAFTTLVVRDGKNDSGNAGITPMVLATQLSRFTFRGTSRSIHRNGLWQVSSAASGLPARTLTVCRFGERLDTSLRTTYKLAAMALYEGLPNDLELRRIEAAFRALPSSPIAAPFSWSDIGSVSAPADPVWLIDGVTIDAVVGSQVDVFKRNVLLATGNAGQTAASTGGSLDATPDDRWSCTPASTAPITLAVTCGASVATLTIQPVAPLAADATTKYIWVLGDSRVNRAGSGWIEIVKTLLGARVSFVGSLGPNSGYTQKHNGRDSWTTVFYTRQSGDGVTPSDLFNGGASLDIAGFWSASLAHAPDIVIINLGQNDVYSAGSLAAAIALITSTVIPNLDTIIAGCQAANPSVKVFVCLGEPLAADPVPFSGASTRNDRHERVHRLAKALLDHYTGEPNIYLVHGMYLSTDTVEAYAKNDAIHTVSSPGHEQHARAIIAAITAHGWS